MIHTATGLKYYYSSLLPIPHGMFCRLGGYSHDPFCSLNFSFHNGDDNDTVFANRRLAQHALHLPSLCSVHQVHSDKVLVISQKTGEQEPSGYDALITDHPGVGLLIQQADCQAVLLYDPCKKVIGAIHNGWKGSVANIIKATITCLKKQYGVNPKDLLAVISPSLGPCCAEFINYRKELPEWMHPFQVRKNHFDFWAISRVQLVDAGIPAGRIEITGQCTRCNTDFFSYRRSRSQGKETTGRNGSIIGLPTEPGLG